MSSVRGEERKTGVEERNGTGFAPAFANQWQGYTPQSTPSRGDSQETGNERRTGGVDRGFHQNAFDGYQAYEGGVIDRTAGYHR